MPVLLPQATGPPSGVLRAGCHQEHLANLHGPCSTPKDGILSRGLEAETRVLLDSKPQADPWQGAQAPSTPSHSSVQGTCITEERGVAVTGSECHCK